MHQVTIGATAPAQRSTESFWIMREQSGAVCTNEVFVDFGPNTADDQATITAVIDGEQVVQTIDVAEE